MGTDSAESVGLARARESEHQAAASLPQHGLPWRFAGACSVRALLLVVALVVVAAWLLTALNAGA